ncbi:hypothetical protein SAMN05216474_0445 [Lishizhenia tianjinensis]|uniref:Uncharacterized protein n=1 Tax=Lishizhenia tianjinensis TaxID=477690 RepID=A0A1I6XUZ8_9FLAO|nr:hypothetical protein [Lishizhenia tianjinensis]SFT41711.1 hypothetical protein SAMN05216474_0445 [Lishizhenia tianjinensis]
MRLRPKSDYLQKASWVNLYVLTKYWESDIAFYKDEIRFLYGLIDRYFIWMTQDEHIEKVSALSAELNQLDKTFNSLSERMVKHRSRMVLLLENAFVQEEEVFRAEHEVLEDDFKRASVDFRILKRKLFEVTETVMDEEKLQHLLTR